MQGVCKHFNAKNTCQTLGPRSFNLIVRLVTASLGHMWELKPAFQKWIKLGYLNLFQSGLQAHVL